MKEFQNSSPQSKVIYLFVFCLVGLILAGSLVTLINGFWDGQLVGSAWGLRLSSAIQMVLMFFMPAYTIIVWSDQNPVSYLGLHFSKSTFYLSLFAFLILILSNPFISLLLELNQSIILPSWLSGLESWMKNLELSAEESTNLLLSGTSIWGYLGNLLIVGVFAAVAEEFFFRGALQQLLVKLFKNKHVGVWMAAFIFSLMHLQFYGFLPRVALGVILGYLFVWSNNLWIPIIIHFMNNALSITSNFFFKDSSVYQSIENLAITPTFIISGLLSFGIIAYLLSVYQLKATNKEVQQGGKSFHDNN